MLNNIRLIDKCGDWGLGIGDWAQSPIPNPQSPSLYYYSIIIILYYNILTN